MTFSYFKVQMHKLMKQAWYMVKTLGFTISKAMKQAWRNFKLRKALKAGNVSFTFKKKDGSIREAVGTLKENVIPPVCGLRTSDPNKVQIFYDVIKEAWRSFKIENLVSVG